MPGWLQEDRADNIPAMLTAREFVELVASVNFYGERVMQAMRRRLIPREVFSGLGLSGGGMVQGATSYAATSYSPSSQASSRAVASVDPKELAAAIVSAGGAGRTLQFNGDIYDSSPRKFMAEANAEDLKYRALHPTW